MQVLQAIGVMQCHASGCSRAALDRYRVLIGFERHHNGPESGGFDLPFALADSCARFADSAGFAYGIGDIRLFRPVRALELLLAPSEVA